MRKPHCDVEDTGERLIPSGTQDDTPKVLRTFVMKLLENGQLALMSEILLFKNDAAKLQQLRNFLVDTILNPSKCLFFLALNIVCF